MKANNVRIGALSPSQLLYTYGVGAIVDLPHLSVIVNGLDDWTTNPTYVKEIQEDRLLHAVKSELGGQVEHLFSMPIVQEAFDQSNPFEKEAHIGVPVSTFPQWMVCPSCRLLAPIQSELFELKIDFYHPDRTHYEHVNCKASRKNPTALPARFLVACERGHLDDFPWVEFVHDFDESKYDHTSLTLSEYGPSGEARDLYVECITCKARRQLAEAFGRENREKMPFCKGRRPHLHDYDPQPCDYHMRAIILGASNLWFSYVMNSIAIPTTIDKLAILVNENWSMLERISTQDEISTLMKFNLLLPFSEFTSDQIWQAIQKKRNSDQAGETEGGRPNLHMPEWLMFTKPNPQNNTPDFRLRPVSPPDQYKKLISRVVLVERMREVRALTGFTRIDSPGELAESEDEQIEAIVPITRRPPTWVPAIQVRGEGVFIQFNEEEIVKWLRKPRVAALGITFFNAHYAWRSAHHVDHPEAHFPGLRYVLLHSFSHALIRQFAIECGYTMASIRERIYSNNADQTGVPMAGVLLYTSAPDSEGTLGGLVNLGEPETLGRHIDAALESCRLCASDPTCAEHVPGLGMLTLHGAACHACQFSPETSCEKGNKYLDRTVLINTVVNDGLSYFESE